MAKRRRRRRKKNLSTGAWIAIGLGVAVGVPALIAGAVALYGIKKGSKIVEREQEAFPGQIPQPQPY